MSVRFVSCRKKNKWVVTWKSPWTKIKHTKTCATEEEALQFEHNIEEITRKDKLLFAKQKNNLKKQLNNPLTIKELFDAYFTIALSNNTTIKQSKYHASHILSPFGNRKVYLISAQDILNFIESQKIRMLKQSTINRRISILKAAINWGIKVGLINENPLHNIRMPQAKIHRSSPPTPQESRNLLEAAAEHLKRIIILGECTGARVGPSELFRLEWWQVDLDNAMIRMPTAQKNEREDGRDIPIRKALLPLLKQWKAIDAEKNIQHVIHWNGQKIKTAARAWKTALKKAGIERKIRPYDLRHAFASYSLEGGADIKTIAEIMAHNDPSMILKVYQHIHGRQKRIAVEAMPDILHLESHDIKAGK